MAHALLQLAYACPPAQVQVVQQGPTGGGGRGAGDKVTFPVDFEFLLAVSGVGTCSIESGINFLVYMVEFSALGMVWGSI